MTPRAKRFASYAAALAVMLIPLLLMVWRHWHGIPLAADGKMFGIADPDPWLRLTLVRDWLSGGSWFDHSVLRTNAPLGGIVSPWTRPLDVVIAGLAMLQPAEIDLSLRLVRASLMLPVVWATLMMIGIYRAAHAIAPLPLTPWMANALALTGLAMWSYFAAGYADHHTPLAVLFVWVVGGLLQRARGYFPLALSGILLGIMLWISPEALILIAAIYGWLGLEWLRGNPQSARQLLVISACAAMMTAVAILIERPQAQWFTPIYDSISIVHGWVMAGCALIALLMVVSEGDAVQPLSFRWRWRISAVSAAILLKALHHFYPLFFHGPLVGVDPFIIEHFLKRINEARPLSVRPWLNVAAMLAQPLAALLITLRAWRGNSIIPRPQAQLLSYLLLITMALYCVEQRWYYYFYPLVIMTLAPWLAALMQPQHALSANLRPARWLQALPQNQQALRRMPLILLLLSAQGLLLLAAPSDSTPHSRAIDACQAAARTLIHGGKLNHLRGEIPLTLFTSTDLGAEILFRTPHRIIASNYHREGPGIRYVWEADAITDPEKLRDYLAQRKVDALLICPVVEAPKGSVLQGLRQGKTPPAWLTPVPFDVPTPSGHVTKPELPVEEYRPAIFLINAGNR